MELCALQWGLPRYSNPPRCQRLQDRDTLTAGENLHVVFLSPLPLYAACFAPLRETLSLHISKQFGKRNLAGSFIVKLKINNKGEVPAKIHSLLRNVCLLLLPVPP